MNQYLPLALSLFLLAGVAIPAHAQLSDGVVINEVDINPPGNDSVSVSEWVELYNPTDSDVDIGGWEIASTTALKKTLAIPPGTVIGPDKFLIFSYQTTWFADSAELVELRDSAGIVVDKTPLLTDIQDDFTSWQRTYDGHDADSLGDWKFAPSTAGSSNGKFTQAEEMPGLVVTVDTSKPSYLFGETAVITGSVSEAVFVEKPYYRAEQIIVSITGPNFDKTVTMYPDHSQNFETTQNLHQVLGIGEGTYDVSVSYAGVSASASFSVGHEVDEQKVEEEGSLSIATGQPQYIPGQTVSITASATKITPLEGMKFTITNPDGGQFHDGIMFPVNGEFATGVFISNVDPVFGTYTIDATYSGRSVSATFEVVEDLKEDVPISLRSDRTAYGLGETVQITGRVNKAWASTLDLEITQIKSAQSTAGGSEFRISDGLTVMGDGSFSHSFTIPEHDVRLGDYRVSVSHEIGSASIVVSAVEDPGSFVASDKPLTVEFDKQAYEIGDTMIVGGSIQDSLQISRYTDGSTVNISITGGDGRPLQVIGQPKGAQDSPGGASSPYEFTAILESGSYSVEIPVRQNIFAAGSYILKAEYLDEVATGMFEISEPIDLSGGPVISTDKEVYGLGETVHLTGIFPPVGTSTVDISITRPDGTITNSGAAIDEQRFSWSWNTPVAGAYQAVGTGDSRHSPSSNFGIYKITVSTDSESTDLFFKVSADPENDFPPSVPIFVSTDKSLYKAGEKLRVFGSVMVHEQGGEGLAIPPQVNIRVLDSKFLFKPIHEASVYPSQGGEFSSAFELPVTIFDEGTYIVKSNYLGAKSETEFSVASDFVFGVDDPASLLLSSDKSEYNPGDTVVITGKPNRLIYLDRFDVGVIQQADEKTVCGSAICGVYLGPVTTLYPSPSGSFVHQFEIPDSDSAAGPYEVVVDADFETKSLLFNVTAIQPAPKPETVIEKENRIAEKTIPISTMEKTVDEAAIAPRVVAGLLITPSRADDAGVNLMVSAEDGTCIIGPEDGCLVRESTRKQGQIYDVVEVDGVSLKVRYSGADARLEKFSVLPESDSAFLPDASWNVEVLKDDQVSRFYYKVTYKTLE